MIIVFPIWPNKGVKYTAWQMVQTDTSTGYDKMHKILYRFDILVVKILANFLSDALPKPKLWSICSVETIKNLTEITYLIGWVFRSKAPFVLRFHF